MKDEDNVNLEIKLMLNRLDYPDTNDATSITLYQAQKFLRNKYKYYVMPELLYTDETGWNTFAVHVYYDINKSKTYSFFKLYEQALLVGIKKACKHLLKKQKKRFKKSKKFQR